MFVLAAIKSNAAHAPATGESRLGRLRAGASNALELLREGRVSTPWAAPYSVLHTQDTYRLRRYIGDPEPGVEPISGPVLLVPPLMIASEIYDISPDLSAVHWLLRHGADVWLVDFGAPEKQAGALQRTLDDHVLAVSDAIDRVSAATGEEVHLAGYSQGGMFVYQCAAFRKSRGVRSLITFGSPVDVHRNLPKIRDDVAGALLEGPGRYLLQPAKMLDALPGYLSMTGFKVLSGSKEIRQILDLVKVLPNREAMEKRELQRRFLGGEGFVAWPGPALHKFIDEMIINNRMMLGGFVIDGRTVTLADITAPILYFVGSRDEFGRPPSVRAINQAAPRAEVHEVELAAGHFGLVVGGRALRHTWPTVAAWMRWQDGAGPQPDFNPENLPLAEAPPDSRLRKRLYAAARTRLDEVWERMADLGVEAGEMLDVLRWEMPRMKRVRRMEPDTCISLAGMLQQKAERLPQAAFFLWQEQAFTFADVNARVNALAAILLDDGVLVGEHVAIHMDNHPDFLSSAAALNRIGAVAVLLNAGMRGASLEHALIEGSVSRVIADAAHIDELAATCPDLPLYCFAGERADLPTDVIDLDERLKTPAMPDAGRCNQGLAADIAMLIFTSGTTGRPRAVRISNRRWGLAALSCAATCTLTTRDTVYCCTPLYHATGMLMACGGALAGGARLALAPGFSASGFLEDTRRYGATVVFYVGEMCRYLLARAPQENEHMHSIRLFIGNGMRPDTWRALQERLRPERIIEFYGSSEGNVALANLAGDKIGSVGRPLNDERDVALVEYEVDYEEFVRADDGFMEPCVADEPGVLLARINSGHPLSHFEGYTREVDTRAAVLHDVFEQGDSWFNTGDLMRRDADGDYWFLDRLGDTYRWLGENVSTEQVADVVSRARFTAHVVVYGIKLPKREGRCGMAAVQLRRDCAFDGAELFRLVSEHLTEAARPRFVRIVPELQTTETLKYVKHRLRNEGVDASLSDPVYIYDVSGQTYRRWAGTEHELEIN